MTRPRTLFVGNGINLCNIDTTDGTGTWGDLISYATGMTPIKSDSAPAPLVYESAIAPRLLDASMWNAGIVGDASNTDGTSSASNLYQAVREKVADYAKQTYRPGSVHDHLCRLPFDNLVTTNYDTCLEQALGIGYSRTAYNIGNSKYLLAHVFEDGFRRIYHAHGIASYPKTICIGTENYERLKAKIRDEVFSRGGLSDEWCEQAQVVANRLIDDPNVRKHLWPELFFTSDIVFIGFGMDYAESDIWWLLAIRAAVFGGRPGDSAKNRLTYYEVVKGDCPRAAEGSASDLMERRRHKLELLLRFDVDTRVVVAPSYAEGYELAIEEAKQEWCG